MKKTTATAAVLLCALGAAPASASEEEARPTCPDGYTLVRYQGEYKCAPTSSLKKPRRRSGTKSNPLVCFFPMVEVWEDTLGEWYCIWGSDLAQPPPIETFYVGICSRPLEGWPFQLGFFRHDDVAGYMKRGTQISVEWKTGFYADNMSDAIYAFWEYANSPWYARVIRYVPGHHQHSWSASPCYSLPKVNRARYNHVNSRRYRVVWNEYHLWLQNCQSWAAEVMR